MYISSCSIRSWNWNRKLTQDHFLIEHWIQRTHRCPAARCWPWVYSLGMVSRYSTVRSGTLTWREWGLWSWRWIQWSTNSHCWGYYPGALSCQVSAIHLLIGHPQMKSTGVWSSNELQWLHIKIHVLHQDSSPNNDHQGGPIALALTHLPLVPHIYINELGHHWFRKWLGAE